MNGPERAGPLIAARMATRRRNSRLKFTCVRAHWKSGTASGKSLSISTWHDDHHGIR